MPCATSRIAAVAAAFVCLVLVVRVIIYNKKENVIKGCPGRSLCPLSVESDRTTDLFCVEDSTWGREFVTRVATSWEPLTRRLLNEEVLKLKPHSVVLEAGVHVGDDLLVMAMNAHVRRPSDGILFLGVEPDKSKVDFINRMIKLNCIPNVNVFHGGLDATLHNGKVKRMLHPGAWTVLAADRKDDQSRDNSCARCKSGISVVATGGIGCQHYCSAAGFCGDTEDYQGTGSTDCTKNTAGPYDAEVCKACKPGMSAVHVGVGCQHYCSAAGYCGTTADYQGAGSTNCIELGVEFPFLTIDHVLRTLASPASCTHSACTDDVGKTRTRGLQLLHLDVEGFEHAALVGGMKTIMHDLPTIIFEQTDPASSLVEPLLESWGYTTASWREESNVRAAPQSRMELTGDRLAYEAAVASVLKMILLPNKRYSDYTFAAKGLTMQTEHDLKLLKGQIESIVDTKVGGDVYETGTWRAGTSIFMVVVFRAYERFLGLPAQSRQFYFFDSFEGFAKEGKEGDKGLDAYLQSNNYAAPLDVVRASFQDCGIDLDDGSIHFTKGFFERTVPAFTVPRKISLLRLDGDLYSSTKVVLDHFYPHVAVGGWAVIDDYNWKPPIAKATTKLCKDAVDEHRAQHSITAPLTSRFGPPAWQV